ncbi:MAG: cobyric acid synthase [Nitrospirota bacterium]|nr:cobyric acid synthase [Nitrospirota bacterium]MDE3225570.1 cobyric acid synthase [Nitrospirota bacterium]MDE3241565.1 cobyric acid synthase [Nitrospirota bacterium]
MAAKTLMVQGTASHVGKSVLVTALCRLFLRRGVKVAPFKAQNMSNNSFVTPDGREIGRAQAVQAAACRLAPRTDFNPVLIKPSGDRTAQLVVNGRVAGRLEAADFGRIKREHWPAVREAFARLADEFDLVILEGAGSPAEINLRDRDIVNMAMAREARAPVLLAGDIDRGGVFASLVGTLALLEPEELAHVKGFVINKFRGDTTLLTPGVTMVEARCGVPCLGVVPHWQDLQVPQEDSLGWAEGYDAAPRRADTLLLGVADVPAISNFTDVDALALEPDVRVVRVSGPIAHPLDALIFPGTKNTAEALRFVKARKLDLVARQVLAAGGTVVGLCGGFQLLGNKIVDQDEVESSEVELAGLGLLDVTTSFAREKVTVGVSGRHRASGCSVEGYEIHMGRTSLGAGAQPWLEVRTAGETTVRPEGASSQDGLVFGTYVHGLFDAQDFRRFFLNGLREVRGWAPLPVQPGASLDEGIDRLADFMAKHVDLAALDAIVERGVQR